MDKFISLTCIEDGPEGVHKYAAMIYAGDIRVMISVDLPGKPQHLPIPITLLQLLNGQRISVSETLSVVKARIDLVREKP